MQKGFGMVYILMGILILGVVAGGGYLLGKQNNKPQDQPSQQACTEEAKLCPDGSSVGRTGLNCEFAECPAPSSSDETGNWKVYTIPRISFSMKYPPNWTVSEKKYGSPSELEEEINFSGLEGNISFKIGTGFGGGCPIPTIVKISDQEIQGCQTEDGKRISFGEETSIPVDLGSGVTSTLGVDVDADINSSIPINKEVILKILSTFKFMN